MQPSMGTNDEEDQEKLADDFDTPFSAPDDTPHTLPQDHQAFEANVDSDDAYQNGELASNQTDEGVGRSPIRMRDGDGSRQHGPVKTVRPARKQLHHAKIFGED